MGVFLNLHQLPDQNTSMTATMNLHPGKLLKRRKQLGFRNEMGANMCCRRSSKDAVRKSVKPRSLRKMHSFPRELHRDSYKVSLKDLIDASPALNLADPDRECNGKGMSYRVSMRSGSVQSGNGKLKKKVSFRSPQVADILVLSPLIYA
ncbi:hypothetical protein AAHA92_02525 [Salvia divinorum]|uniref:Uncharacterized protein n=1 Tax=Salvia divinorum TaxID=28513 RepID=A0ABD1IGV2_SALDI